MSAAAAKAELLFEHRLDVEATLQAMQAVKASWSGLRNLRILLNHLGVHLKFASERNCKAALSAHQVSITYSEMPLGSGKARDNHTTMCLVCSSPVFEVLARDLDARVADGSFLLRSLPNDVNHFGRPVLHLVVNEDAGGASSKWTIRFLDVKNPCGNKTCSIFCSVEPKKPEEAKQQRRELRIRARHC